MGLARAWITLFSDFRLDWLGFYGITALQVFFLIKLTESTSRVHAQQDSDPMKTLSWPCLSGRYERAGSSRSAGWWLWRR